MTSKLFSQIFGFVVITFLSTSVGLSQCSDVVIVDFTADGTCSDCGPYEACSTTSVTLDNSDPWCCVGTNNQNSSRCRQLNINTPNGSASCFELTGTPQDSGANWWMVDGSNGDCGTLINLSGGTEIVLPVYDEGGVIEIIICKQGTGTIDIELCAIPCCEINDFDIPDADYLCYEDVPTPTTVDEFIAIGGIVDITDLVGSNGCDDLVLSYTDSAIPNDICIDKVWTRTYHLCFCGDQDFYVDQTLTISADNLPPELEIGGSTEDFPPIDWGCVTVVPSLPFELSVTNVSDDCSVIDPGDVVITDDYPGVETSNCNYIITRTYSISDACDAFVEVSEFFTYTLNANPPSFDNPPADITLSCAADLTAAEDLTWIDDCDGTGTVSPTENQGTIDNCTGGTITRTWEYTDQCGLTGTYVQNIVIEPIIALTWENPPGDMTITCGDPIPPMEDISYTNGVSNPACEETGIVSPTESGSLNSCGDQLIRTYEYTSPCGTTINHTQTISILDFESPEFDNPPADITVECYGDIPPMPDLVWTDNCDGTGSVTGTESGTIDNCSQSTITRTFTYTDACNNITSYVQNIQIEPIPSIVWTSTLPGPITIACDDPLPPSIDLSYSNSSASADCLNEGLVSSSDSGSLDQCGDQITRSWTVPADPANCIEEITHIQLITLMDDVPPYFINLPPSSVNVNCVDDIPLSQDLEWEDACDGNGTVSYVDNGNPDGCDGGTITRTWTHTDACGNGPITFTQVYILSAPEFVTCDDGDPCTVNDMEKVDCAGNICIPCQGIPSDCSGLTTSESCDDGDPCTENDMQEVACDGTICVPCLGVPVSTCSGSVPNVILPCDDGDPCTIDDVQEVDGCDLTTECVPCQGTYNPTPDPTPPTGSIACLDETTSLSLTGCGGVVTWYDSPDGTVLFVGETFVTPIITADISFYVSCTIDGCESNLIEVPVTVVTAVVPNISGPDLICNGQETVTISADAGYASYDWGNGNMNSSLIVSDPGTYGVTVTDANGCTSENTYTVNAATLPDISIAGSTTFCTGGSTSLNVPVDFESYIWAPNNETTPAIDVSSPGTYSVTVTDASGCTDEASITVAIADNLMPQITGDLSFCEGGTGTIGVGSGYAAVTWAPNGENSESITIDEAITYSVTVTDAGGCTGVASIDITEDPNPIPNITGPTEICSNSSITISGEDGFEGYEWGDGSINQDLTITSDGTYTLIVTDSNGCQGSTSVDITLIPDPDVEVTGDLLLCSNGQGTALLVATAGYEAYEWSGGSANENETTVSEAGTYSVTVTDINGCTNSASTIVNIDTPPVVEIDGNLSFCSGFSTTLTATAGFVEYLWSNGEMSSSIDADMSGTYDVIVTDANGCTNSASIIISELSELDPMILGELDICPGDYEEITLSLQGTYETYDWGSGPGTESTLLVTDPGTYNVTVTDANGCSGNSSITIVENVVAPLDIMGGPNFCNGTTVTLTASAGFDSYTWSNGINANSITVNEPGLYSVVGTDANGCTNEAEITINQIDDPTAEITGDLFLCPGGDDMVTLIATPGYESYAWAPGSSSTNELVVNGPETYTVTVTDENGCTNTASVTVGVDEAPVVVIDGNQSFCSGFSTTLTATDGYVDYVWSNGETTNSITTDMSGTYDVVVTDANGCTNSATVTVSELSELAPEILGETDICPGDYEEITLSVQGTYDVYDWGSGPGTESTLLVTDPGTYNVTVTDSNGCSGNSSITITENVVAPLDITGGPTFCNGSTVTISASAGFDTYVWSNGIENIAIAVNEAGVYTVVATDANGCTNSAEITIEEIEDPMIEVTGDLLLCPGGSDMVTLTATAGYESYSWAPGSSTTNELIVDAVGTYTVTVTDEFGCTNTAQVDVEMDTPPDVEITGNETFCLGFSTIFTATAGYVEYEWTNGETTNEIEVTETGTYTVTVTDEDGCTNTASIDAVELTQLEPMILGDLDICPGEYEEVTLSLDGNYVAYEWNDLSTGETLIITGAGTYSVTVTDASGCSGNSSITVVENEVAEVNITGGMEFCAGSDLNLFASGGFDSYIWSTDETSQNISVNEPGTYSVTATDSNVCTNSASIDIVQNELPIPIITGELAICEGQTTTLDVGSWLTYTWSTGETVSTIEVSEPGDYSVVVTDDNGCEGTAMVTVIVNELPIPVIIGDLMFCLGGSTDLSVEGTYAGYEWQDGSTESTVNVTETGDYSLTVTDDNGCSASATVNIVLQDFLYPTITGPDLVCLGSEIELNAGTFDFYEWEDGSEDNPHIVTSAGTYEVTVTDLDGCTGTATFTVDEAEPEPVEIIGDDFFCAGLSTTLTAQGDNLVGFEWSNGVNTITNEIDQVGTYVVIATDINGCTSSAEITIIEEPNPEPVIIGDAQFCIGTMATLEVMQEYVSYVWSTGEETQSIMTDIVGTYTVIVTDENGCVGETSFDIELYPEVQMHVGGPTMFCEGGYTTLYAEGYDSVIWSTEETTESIQVSVEGDYSVTVTDVNGCMDSLTLTVTEQEELMPEIIGDESFCEGESAILNAGSGYTFYSWDDESNGFHQTVTIYEPGTYSVTVTDDFGCTGEDSFVVTENPKPVVEITGEFEVCEGGITEIFATPGYESYEWSPAGASESITVANEGTYIVTVTDLNGCTAVADIFVDYLPLPEPEIWGLPVICYGYNNSLEVTEDYVAYEWSTDETTQSIEYGSLDPVYVTVTDDNGCTGVAEFSHNQYEINMPTIVGSPTYCTGGGTVLDAGLFISYEWEGPVFGNDQFLEATIEGTYTVFVTDYNGCTTSASIDVEQALFLDPEIEGDGVFCTGSSTILDAGVFDIYEWEGPISGNTQTLEVDIPGTYTLTVSDDTGCFGTAQIVVEEVDAPAPVISGGLAICDGNTTTLTIDEYETIEWSTGQTSPSIVVAEPGNYTVIVTDLGGCTGAASVTVESGGNPSITISGDDYFCPGGSTQISAGFFESYAWSTGETTQSITVDEAGEYSVIVTDENGCEGQGSISISSLSGDNLIIGGSTSFCVGSSTILDAGSQYESYEWSTGETTQTIEVETEGAYTVTVIDLNGCIQSATVEVSEQTTLTLTILGDDVICEGETTILDAGNFATWVWDTPEGPFNTQTIEVSTPGIYYVTVDDGNGCTGMGEFTLTVEDMDPPMILGELEICENSSSILSLDEEYTSYNWSTGDNSPTIDVSVPGTYSVEVSNASGCTATTSVLIESADAPVVSILGPTEYCEGSTVLLDAGDFESYEWSIPGATSQTITIGSPGIISVTVTDANGCQGVGTTELSPFPTEPMQINGSLSFCTDSYTILEIDNSFSNISWSTGEQGPSIEVDTEGEYTATADNEYGCQVMASVNIISDDNLAVTLTSSSETLCEGSSATIDAGSTFNTYEWSNGETSSSIAVTEAGTYSVLVSDQGGCTGMASITIEEGEVDVPGFLGNTEFCSGSETTIELNQNYASYAWSTGETTPSITVDMAGTYSVIVTSFDGCEATNEIVITEASLPQPQIEGDLTFCESGSTTLSLEGFEIYIWSVPGQNQSELTVTDPGTYSVTVSDINGCQAVTTVDVNTYPTTEVEIAGSTSFCVGTSTFLSVSNDWVSQEWSNGETSQNIEVTSSGTISVIVTDVNGCTAEASAEITEDSSLFPVIIGNNELCEGESTILDAGFGFGNYEWSTGETGQFISVDEAGTYEVVVTDPSGQCSGIGVIDISLSDIDKPSIIGPDKLCPEELAYLSIDQEYASYEWSNGQTTEAIEIMGGGIYSVVVTNDNGCTATESIEILDEDAPEYSIGDVSCEDGLDTYSVIIETTSEITGNNLGLPFEQIADDVYMFSYIDTTLQLEVTIGNGLAGCESNIVVPIPNCGCLAIADAGADLVLDCDSGMVMLSGEFSSMGVNFLYEWRDEDGNVISTDINTAVNQGGTYTLVVTDVEMNCSVSDKVFVDASSLPEPSIVGDAKICEGSETTLNVTEEYSSYSWSIPGTNNNITVSQGGTYTVTVTDDDGCEGVASFVVEEFEMPSYNVLDRYCNEDKDSYTVLFQSDAVSIESSLSLPLVDLGNGMYEMTGIDTTLSVDFTLVGGLDECGNSFTIYPPNCFCDAYADPGPPAFLSCTVDVVTLGGVLTTTGDNFTMSWTNEDGEIISDEQYIDVSAPGMYTLSVYDIAMDCYYDQSVFVEDMSNEPIALILSDSDNIIDCELASIALYVDPEENTMYTWSVQDNEMSGVTIDVEGDGEVVLMAIDTITGCLNSDTLMIEDMSEYPFIEFDEPEGLDCNIIETTLTASTIDIGNEILVEWYDSDGETIPGNDLSTTITEPGVYYIQLTDSVNGCTNLDSIVVEENSFFPEIEAGQDMIIPCDETSVNIEVLVENDDNRDFIYNWSTPDGNIVEGGNDLNPIVNQAGTYFIEITDDATGCKTIDSLVVDIVDEKPYGIISEAINPPCSNEAQGMIHIDEILGGDGPYTYSLNGGLANDDGFFENLDAGTYELLVTDANGCVHDTLFNLEYDHEVTLEAEPPEVTVPYGEDAEFDLVTNLGFLDIAGWEWNNTNGLSCLECLHPTVTAENDQEFTVIIYDEFGCSDTTTFRVLVDRDKSIWAPNIMTPGIGEFENQQFTVYTDDNIEEIDELYIFDRWGELMYSNKAFPPNNPHHGWDGKFKGKYVVDGVYVYLVKYHTTYGEENLFKGDITIIR